MISAARFYVTAAAGAGIRLVGSFDPGGSFSKEVRALTPAGRAIVVVAALVMIVATAAAVFLSRRRMENAERRTDRSRRQADR